MFLEFEKAEQERMSAELEEHERQLERETAEEHKKNEKAIQALNARKEALLKEKKVKAKQELGKLVKQGASKDEQEALLKEHNKDLAKLMNKMDSDRLRMQAQLESRIKKKREERKRSKIHELEQKAKEAKSDFQDELNKEEDLMKNNAKIILRETINVDDLVKASVPEPTVSKIEEEVSFLCSLTQGVCHNMPRNCSTRFFISNQVAKGLTLNTGLKVKQLAKQPPTLKTLIHKILVEL